MNRYIRHISLPEIGEEGQRKLSSAKVALIGAGGLGSPALYSLASAGVGNIHIIDYDKVDVSNLNRQFIHFQADIGRMKAQSAKEKLERYNPTIQINTSATKLGDDNIHALIANTDLVLSCVDNKETRYLLNSASVKSGTALVDAGVQGFYGYVLVVDPGVTPCYECIFPRAAQARTQAEESPPVLGAVTSVLGSMMALEAIRHIVGIPAQTHFYYVDMLTCQITPIAAIHNSHCSTCGM